VMAQVMMTSEFMEPRPPRTRRGNIMATII